MIFQNPRTDVAFKKLFGDAAKTDIIISFLNSILDRKNGNRIARVVVRDPGNSPKAMFYKETAVDIRCTDQKGRTYIVEMQVVKEIDFAARSQFYSANCLAQQLKEGTSYGHLMPVIFVGVLNFNLFPETDYLSHHIVVDTKTKVNNLKHLEWHFIELPKFDKKLEDIDTIADKWIYLLKNAQDLRMIPDELKKPAALAEAMEVLERHRWSDADLYDYEKYWDNERSKKSQLETALLDQSIEIAKKMLGSLPKEKIAEITGLTVEEIEEL